MTLHYGSAYSNINLVSVLQRICKIHNVCILIMDDDDDMLDNCLEVSFNSALQSSSELLGCLEACILNHTPEEPVRIDKESCAKINAWLCFSKQEHMQEIVPGLWLGSVEALDNVEELKKQNILYNLNLSCRGPAWNPFVYREFRSKAEFIVDDKHVNLLAYLPSFRNCIDDALKSGHGILVNCARGRSRSASVVIDYLMTHKCMTFENALQLCRSKRPCVKPNSGFQKQLKHAAGFFKKKKKEQQTQ